jgi:hypothetical protein
MKVKQPKKPIKPTKPDIFGQRYDKNYSSVEVGWEENRIKAMVTTLNSAWEYRAAVDLVSGKLKFSSFDSYSLPALLAWKIIRKASIDEQWVFFLENVSPRRAKHYSSEMTAERVLLNTRQFDEFSKPIPGWVVFIIYLLTLWALKRFGDSHF